MLMKPSRTYKNESYYVEPMNIGWKKSMKKKAKKSRKTKATSKPTTYKFWREFNKSDGYELAFSYSASLGDVIIQGLNKNQSWLVKDERGRIIYSTGGKSC